MRLSHMAQDANKGKIAVSAELRSILNGYTYAYTDEGKNTPQLTDEDDDSLPDVIARNRLGFQIGKLEQESKRATEPSRTT